jgi:hypothetical protein
MFSISMRKLSIFFNLLILLFISNCANSEFMNEGELNKNQTLSSSPQWTLWNTYYYVSNEVDHPANQTTPIYSTSCNKIADSLQNTAILLVLKGQGNFLMDV